MCQWWLYSQDAYVKAMISVKLETKFRSYHTQLVKQLEHHCLHYCQEGHYQ